MDRILGLGMTILASEPVDRILGFDSDFLESTGMQILNVIILFFILRHLLYKPVLDFLQGRTDRIQKQIKNAETTFAEAEELKASYEQKLADVEKERAEILEAARKNAATREAQIIEEATKEAKTIVARAYTDIEREQERVKDEIKNQIIEVAYEMARGFVADKMDEDKASELFEKAMNDLGDATWQN